MCRTLWNEKKKNKRNPKKKIIIKEQQNIIPVLDQIINQSQKKEITYHQTYQKRYDAIQDKSNTQLTKQNIQMLSAEDTTQTKIKEAIIHLKDAKKLLIQAEDQTKFYNKMKGETKK